MVIILLFPLFFGLLLLFYHKIRYNATVAIQLFHAGEDGTMEQTKQAAVGCVIMASGRAVRFGSDKLLADFGGCIFLPGDQPLLRRESLEAMVRDFHAQKETERVILRLGWRAGGAEPLLGSPVLFGSGHFDALRALPEGRGGGVVIRQHPGCVRAVYAQSAEELEDADTVERLEALKRFL